MCVLSFLTIFGSVSGPITNAKKLDFTVEMLCFGSAQGCPEGGPGAPPGGRFEIPKRCKSIVFCCVFNAVGTQKLIKPVVF